MTILVAEDDPDDRLMLSEAFEENGSNIEVDFVKDGEELLQYLRREDIYTDKTGRPQPAVVLLDLNMPKVDGREALRQIKDDPNLRVIPIVVLTTSKAPEDVETTYKCGVNSFVSKPRDFDELIDLTEQICRYWTRFVRLPEASYPRLKLGSGGSMSAYPVPNQAEPDLSCLF